MVCRGNTWLLQTIPRAFKGIHPTGQKVDDVYMHVPLCRNPCNGARPVRVGRQGGVPAEQGLGRVEGRRLGDYMWLRALCAQACYAGGPGPFRYLLYKDVNRHMKLPSYGR